MSTTPDAKPAAAGIPVRCPGCGEQTMYVSTNPYRPFCSARCQGLDLGAWASENYRVAAPDSDETTDNA